MTRRRRLLLLVVATLGLVTATGGYTAVSNDRTVGVAVAPPGDGYVDATAWPNGKPVVTAGGGTATAVLRVDNRFGFGVQAAVTLGEATGGEVTLDDAVQTVGGAGTFDGTVSCDASTRGTVAVPVAVTVDGGDAGVEVVLDRTLRFECSAPTTPTPTETETPTGTETATDTAEA